MVTPRVEHEVVAGGALEAVAERQEAERRPLVVHHREDLLRGEDVVEEVAVGEHDPLGVAGGARGVDEGGEVVSRHLGGAPAHRVGVGAERLPALRPQLVERRRPRGGRGVEADDVPEVRELRADLRDLRRLGRVRDEDDLRLRVGRGCTGPGRGVSVA